MSRSCSIDVEGSQGRFTGSKGVVLENHRKYIKNEDSRFFFSIRGSAAGGLGFRSEKMMEKKNYDGKKSGIRKEIKSPYFGD